MNSTHDPVSLHHFLQEQAPPLSPVLPEALLTGPRYVFNTTQQGDFIDINPLDLPAMIQRSETLLQAHGAVLGIGTYAEDRTIYTHAQYQGPEPRTVHLGLDLSAPAGTPVFAPLEGRLHSLADNAQPGDYGPTLILEHSLAGRVFFTLYGHLSRASLLTPYAGLVFPAGTPLGTIGQPHENGGWPPHLHFQLIDAIADWRGDFPGAVQVSKAHTWLDRCPDPNLLIGLKLEG